MHRRKRWLALLLALVLAAGLLPTAALASDERAETTDGETGDGNTKADNSTETGGAETNSDTKTGNGDGNTETGGDTLSDGISVTSTENITRAQMAEMVYEHKSLKTDIDSMAAGGTAPEFTDI